ncbi:MAG: hypothetical protein AB1505_26990 [Candidatus Latescibacterota bacterium]
MSWGTATRSAWLIRRRRRQDAFLVLLHAGELLQEVAAERVPVLAHGTVGLTDELGHDVEVTDLRQELGEAAELPVGVHLFKVGLGQPAGIGLVVGIRSAQHLLPPAPDGLFLDDGAPGVVLVEGQAVSPFGVVQVQARVQQV